MLFFLWRMLPRWLNPLFQQPQVGASVLKGRFVGLCIHPYEGAELQLLHHGERQRNKGFVCCDVIHAVHPICLMGPGTVTSIQYFLQQQTYLLPCFFSLCFNLSSRLETGFVFGIATSFFCDTGQLTSVCETCCGWL